MCRTNDNNQARSGVLYGVVAYSVWGLVPIYFKAVADVPAVEVLCHRIFWSWVFTSLLLLFWRRWSDVVIALRDRSIRWRLVLTSVLLAVNWLTFIYAVSHSQVLQAKSGVLH